MTSCDTNVSVEKQAHTSPKVNFWSFDMKGFAEKMLGKIPVLSFRRRPRATLWSEIETERNYRLKSSAPDPGASCEESEPCPNVIQTGTVNERRPTSPPYEKRSTEWCEERGEYARRVPYKTSQRT